MQVIVIGNMISQEGFERVSNAEKLVLSNPTVKGIVPLKQGILEMFMEVSPDYDWASDYFEFFVKSLESADRAVFLAENGLPQSLGWLMGYCFALAIPVTVLIDKPVTDYTSDVFLTHSITATLGDMQELTTYDFREANIIYTGVK